MLATIDFQGYRIDAPPGPPEQGSLASHPTAVQVVSQVDQQLVYWAPDQYVAAVEGRPANELVSGTVTFQCYWDTIFNAVAQDTQVTQSVTYTSGIVTTDTDTRTFGMSLGVEGAVDGIKAALGASFSVSEAHSVALSESRSVTQSFTALPGTTLQVWQLYAQYITEFEKDGQAYRAVLTNAGAVEDGLVVALTFPEAANVDTSQ